MGIPSCCTGKMGIQGDVVHALQIGQKSSDRHVVCNGGLKGKVIQEGGVGAGTIADGIIGLDGLDKNTPQLGAGCDAPRGSFGLLNGLDKVT